MIWSMLLHLSFNFWDNRPDSISLQELSHRLRSDDMRCDDETWNATLQALKQNGANQVIIDLGDGVRFDSHPEIALKDAWSKNKLYDELNKIRELGMEPIPKLNFSAGHDEWMGPYARMISTPAYYDFCRDLIAESMELFGTPAYFHIGMDEENQRNQREYTHAVIRQHELWYSDLEFYANEITSRGARPWMWSDKMWEDEDRYVNRVSRDIVQSNWYYGIDYGGVREPLPGEATFQRPEHIPYFEKLEKAGFDQIPTASNYTNTQSLSLLVEHCTQVISPGRLLGFLHTTWYPTIVQEQHRMLAVAEQIGRARAEYSERK